MSHPVHCTAFAGGHLLAAGLLPDVALALQAALARDPAQQTLVFDDATGKVVDLDLRGSPEELAARYVWIEEPRGPELPPDAEAPSRGRGRPRLGVVAREVTLLPRQWEWLGAQPGGASQTLRRLVDDARRTDVGQGRARAGQEAAYCFMSAIGGDLPGFEEACRALFASDRPRFQAQTAAWPGDLRRYAAQLAWGTGQSAPD